MSAKSLTALTAAAFIASSVVTALAQSGGAGGTSGGAGGAVTSGTGTGTGGSSPGTSTPGGSVPSGTGPTPAPAPGQSFTFPSNAGTPGTGTTDNRVPSGTGPTPAPTQTPGSEASTPNALTPRPPTPGSETSSGGPTAAQRRDCENAAERQERMARGGTAMDNNTVGIGTTTGGTPRIVEDPRLPKEDRTKNRAPAGC